MKSHAKNLEDSAQIERFTAVLEEALKIPIFSVIFKIRLVSLTFKLKMKFSCAFPKKAANRSILLELSRFFVCDSLIVRGINLCHPNSIFGPRKFLHS